MKKISFYLILLAFSTSSLSGQNLVNGNFENGNPGQYAFCIIDNVTNWLPSHGTPSLGSSPSQHAGMWSRNFKGEGIFANYDFQDGNTYEVKCDLKFWNSGNPEINSIAKLYILAATDLQRAICTAPNGPLGEPVPSVENKQIIITDTFSNFTVDNNWYSYTFHFTADGNYNQFWVYPDLSLTTSSQAELSIDNIEIEVICTSTPQAIYHFENEKGDPQDEFCLGEMIYLNGSASEGEDEYKLNVSRTNLNTNTQEDFSTIGWFSGTVETINLTTLFLQESIPLDQGYEYDVSLTVRNSICVEEDFVTHSFEILPSVGTAAFHFENELGIQQNEFCLGETIYLDGSASEGEDEYRLDVSRTNLITGAQDDFSTGGWMSGTIETINLTMLFDNFIIPLELDHEYFVTLTIRNLPCLEETLVTHSFTLLPTEGIAAFHFEDEQGNQQDEFCVNDAVYLNGNASVGDEEYLLGVSTYNTVTGITIDYSNIGWNQGPVGVFNLTDLLNLNEVPLEQGLRYDITLSIRDLPCIEQASIQHSFVFTGGPSAAFHFENALGEPQEVFCFGEDIYLNGEASEDEQYFTILASRREINTSGNFDLVSTLPATQGMVATLNISDLFANFGIPNHSFEAGYEYEIELIVGNECGSASVSHRFSLLSNASLDSSFSLTPSAGQAPGIPVTATQYELYEDEMAVHDWYVFYTPNNGSGPYTLERFLLDEPSILFRPPWVGFYIVIHKVTNPCGEESCYGQVLHIGDPWEQFNCEAVAVCNDVDCSIIESLIEQGPCQGDECGKLVEISPNPSNGFLNIKVSNADTYEIEILDIYGTRLLNHKFQNNGGQIDLQHLNTGMYFVRVFEQGKLLAVKTWIKE